MDSEVWAHWRTEGFAFGIWLRAFLISVLTFAAIVALMHRLYATAVVLGGVGLLVGFDLRRSAAAADRLMAQFVDGLFSGSDDRPAPQPGTDRLHQAIDRALDHQRLGRAESQRRLDFAEALADNVVAALFVVDPGGAVVMANRAARLAFGETGLKFDRIEALGPAAAARLLTLPLGAREIVAVADGRPMLASVTGFSAPGGAPLRLIALQGVPGQLDVVVLKAWQDLVRVLAHEMMNSLTPICSLSDTIAGRLRQASRSPADIDDAAEAAQVISLRGAGLMDFVERYRKLAELPPVVRSRLNAVEFLGRLDQLMSPSMRETGVEYGSAVEEVVFNADASLLEQAIINLLKNALEAAAGQAGAMVRLSCRSDGEVVVIAVEDNGPGLAGDAETMFVPFFTTKLGGSGVGLTLARQIALAHGGKLEHERRAPTGSVFRLTVPL